ncbi:MAG: pyruvate kinase [Candidatus Hydrogenedens sp.]|nr:pyruvate kinase [Candidatus Hydrogenedens sp.]
MRRRTKIVCTIGPASNTPERMDLLLRAGMNVARLNFSHGAYEMHERNYHNLRAAAERQGVNLAILQDLQGPKIRTGKLQDGAHVLLEDGEELTITTDEIVGSARKISTSYKNLPYDVAVNDSILLADGTLELRVCKVSPPDVVCEIVRGGMLGEHKGINLPGVKIAEPSLTGKDREDLAFGLKLGVDFVALSFVRAPEEVIELRQLIQQAGSHAGVVAKIERPEALERFDEILPHCDAVMVARGDLGVEVDYAEVPFIQKRLIGACNELGVPVITATQMLESMVDHARPTRAEVSDVSSACLDGTDAVMLSAETAAGAHPIDACAVMARIAYRTDEALSEAPPAERMMRLRTSDLYRSARQRPSYAPQQNVHADAIGQAVCRMATSLDARRIICFTTTGYTAAAIARYRPPVRISAFTNSVETQRRCALLWGVNAMVIEHFDDIEVMMKRAEEVLLSKGLAEPGDTVIFVAGTPFVKGGKTNLLKLHTIESPAQA